MEQLQDLSLMSSDPRTIWKELGLSTVEEWWCSKSWQDEPDRSEYCMWWEWPLCYDPLRFISWFFDLFLPFINHSAHVHNIHISHICLATHHTYLPYLLYPNIFLTLWLHIFCHLFLRGVKYVMSFFWWCYAIPYCYTFLISLLLFFRLCTTLRFFLSSKPYCCDHCAITIHHTIKSIKFDVVLFKSASHFHHLPPFYLRGDLLSVFYMNTVMLHFSLTHTHTPKTIMNCAFVMFSAWSTTTTSILNECSSIASICNIMHVVVIMWAKQTHVTLHQFYIPDTRHNVDTTYIVSHTTLICITSIGHNTTHICYTTMHNIQ